MGRCQICGESSPVISSRLGVCLQCIREKPGEALKITDGVHAESRKVFGFPAKPPRDPNGVACGMCANDCRIGVGERGFCGLVLNINGRIVRMGGTPEKGVLQWYYDPLPTNCVAWWFCPGCTGAGYPKYAYKPTAETGYSNLAVFYGACLPAFEKIFVIINGKPLIVNIGKLFELVSNDSGNSNTLLGPYILSKPRQLIKIVALDTITCKMGFESLNKISKRHFDGQILKIVLETGRTLHVTSDHLMIILQKNSFAIISAEKLRAGDYIPLAKTLPRPGDGLKEIDLIHEFSKKGFNRQIMVHGAKKILYNERNRLKQIRVKKYMIDNWRRSDSFPLWVFNFLNDGKIDKKNLRISLKYSNKENSIPAVIPLSRELARLLGYYISEGDCSEGRVQFSVGIKEHKIASEIQALLKTVFGTSSKSKVVKYRGKKSSLRIDVRNKTLEILLEKIFEIGEDSYTKRIPWFVFLAHDEFISELLDTYLVGDGHIRPSKSNKKIRNSLVILFNTASHELAYGLNVLLLRLNVQPHVYEPKDYRNTHLFRVQGGERLQTLAKTSPKLIAMKGFDNIPIANPQALVPVFELYPSFLLKSDKNTGLKIYGERISLRRLRQNESNLPEFLRTLIKGDIHPVKIRKIETVHYKGYVYDIQVGTVSALNKTFMLASGIITHNCSYDCLFCQNWHYRNLACKLQPLMSAESLADKADSHVACICYFGGDPSVQMPHAIKTSQIALEKAERDRRILRICWETNGYEKTELALKAAELSLRSGGNLKFDLKAWNPNLNTALCGVSNEPTLKSFKTIGENFFEKRIELPILTASTLLVPGYVDAEEVENIARYIGEIDPRIPYTLLAFYPQYVLNDLPTTSRQQANQCYDAAKKYVENVRIGNIHLLGC